MKISFWITAVVLFCTVRFVFPNNLKVGTVLFTTTDIVKKCWTESDKALLRARLIMQGFFIFILSTLLEPLPPFIPTYSPPFFKKPFLGDQRMVHGATKLYQNIFKWNYVMIDDVLPEPDCINFSKPGVVAILLDYFQSCYKIISSSSYGKSQNLMFLALSDTVGGYLRAYILPISKRAYYAGQVNYSETSKLFQLYNDIKMFLKTNGLGWAKPYKLGPLQTIPKPLVISATGGQMACDNLYIVERKSKFHFNRPQKIRSNLSAKLPTKFEEKTEQTTSCPELRPLCDDEGPTYRELQKLKSILLPNETDKTTTEVPFKNSKQRSIETTTTSTVGSESGSKDKKEWKRIFRNESVTDRRLRKRESLSKRRHNLENIEKDSYSSCRNENQSDSSEFSPYLKADNPLMGCLVTSPDEKHGKKVIIPLPVLDDSLKPFTLAVPFKFQPLRSIRGRSSAFVLEHYYVSVIKCMINKGSSKGEIKQFNGHFFSWLSSDVYPHLEDEVWYPAFGGVLRIAETIKKLGADSSIKDPIFNDVGYMFPNKFEFGDSSKKSGKEKIRDVGDVMYEEHSQSKRLITYGILVTAVACLFVFWACIFCVKSLKIGKSYRPPIIITYSSTKKPEHDGNHRGCGREQCSNEVCYDGVLMTKAERKVLKKVEKKSKWDRARQRKRERRKLKRVADWKEMVNEHKGGGDRLPLFKLPWTFVEKKKQEKGDSTDEENLGKCLIHDSFMPTWSSKSPFIALQKLGSRLNTSSTPISTDVNQDSKVLRKPLDKIQLIWKKPSNKSSKTCDDKETQDTEQLRKTSLDSTFESSKEKELMGTIPSDSYTYSVEDERRCHHVKKRSTSHDRSETCLISSRTATSPSSETPETSLVESETDGSYSRDSDSSRRTRNCK